MKLQDERHDITVLERDSASARAGWGITISHDMLRALSAHDADSARRLRDRSLPWETHLTEVQGHQTLFPRTGLSLARIDMVDTFRERALELGVDLQFDRKIEDASQVDPSDLTIAADGANSRIREGLHEHFGTRFTTGKNMYAWLGTTKPFRMCTFSFVKTDAGWLWLHADGLKDGMSACVVECSPETWGALGLDSLDADESLSSLSRILQKPLDGHALLSRSADDKRLPWIQFRGITNRTWYYENIALMGDAAHTTHFSIGSGTRLALEDAMSLAAHLQSSPDLQSAMRSYQQDRLAGMRRLQSEAHYSARWFENIDRYADLDPAQFASLLQYRGSRLLAHVPPRAYYRLRTSARKLPALRGLYRRLA